MGYISSTLANSITHYFHLKVIELNSFLLYKRKELSSIMKSSGSNKENPFNIKFQKLIDKAKAKHKYKIRKEKLAMILKLKDF